MKIGFYAPLKPPDHPAPSGDRRMARLFIMALESLGHQVTVISRLRSYNRDGALEHEVRTAAEAEKEVVRLSQLWQHDSAQRPNLLFTYHVYHKAADYICPILKQRFAIPYVIAEPSVAPKRESGPWSKGYAHAGIALKAADALLAITELDRICLSSFAGTAKTRYFHPFLDPTPYVKVAARRAEYRQSIAGRYDLSPEKPWLLAVGMMRGGDKLASFHRLAEAMALLHDLPHELILVGDGPERSPVEAAFAGSRARFTGQLDAEELAEFYAASDLYVWPAINEAYGLALLEAQAAGLPVVSVRTRGVPDIVRHGETGWLVEDHSNTAIAAGVRATLADKDRLTTMALAAARRVAKDFSTEAAQRRLAALFIQLGLPT